MAEAPSGVQNNAGLFEALADDVFASSLHQRNAKSSI
jgi:hypothetical protein